MEQDDQDWQHRWHRLKNHAQAEVRRGFLPPFVKGRRSERLLRIVYLPSFEDAVGWELFEVREGDTPASALAHRTTWRQEQDLRSFGGPQDRLAALRHKFHGDATEPTLAYKSVTPHLRLVRDATARLAAMQVSLRNPSSKSMGCDGDSYELTLGDFWVEVTLRWWEEPPAEWSEAGAVTKTLLEHLEGLVREVKEADNA